MKFVNYSKIISKKELGSGLFVLLSTLLFFSCSEDIIKELFGDQDKIEVTANVNGLNMPFTTRSAVTDLNDGGFTISEDDDLNKVRVFIKTGETPTSHEYTFEGTAGTSTTSLIEDEVTYFPKDVNSVDVYGHYPYSEGFSNISGQQYFTIQQNQTTVEGYLKSDLMTADNSAAQRTMNGDGTWSVSKNGAHLDFKHQMAKVIVEVTTDESGTGSGLNIKKVEINGVKPRVPVSYSNGEYTIGEAVNAIDDDPDANEDDRYDLPLLSGTGKAMALIPPQRFNVEGVSANDPDYLKYSRAFITVTADFTNPNIPNAETQENLKMVFFFKGDGKFFKANQVYNIKLILGIRNANLFDEYGVYGVELAKWAGDDATSVIVNAAEEKLAIAAEEIETSVAATAATKVYTGSAHTLDTSIGELTITHKNGSTLVEGDDYELHYASNVNVGQAVVTIMGIGRYAGTLEEHFEITPKDITTNVDVTFPHVPTFDGSEQQPTPTLYDNDRETELTRYDYETLDWQDNTNVTTSENRASVLIKGTGNYEGERRVYFSISPASGGVTFDDAFDTSGSVPTLTLIKPQGHEFDYVDTFKDVLGDGDLIEVVSDNEEVLDITNIDTANKKWKFHVYKSGTANLTFTMGGHDYQYTSPQKPTCRIIITDGPALPIEYVAPHDIGSFSGSGSNISLSLAADDKSEHSCWLSWYYTADRSQYMSYLCKNGLTISGEHYHLPSTYEWRSIFPGGCITWTKTFLNAVEANVAFGVTKNSITNHKNNANGDWKVDDYVFGMDRSLTKTWISDFYSPNESNPYVNTSFWGASINPSSSTEDPRPSRKCFALRFKGTTYCSAWRYDWVWTLDNKSTVSINGTNYNVTGTVDNQTLTGNTVGRKTVIVRVKYLGPSYTGTVNDLVSLDWDNYGSGGDVIIRRFPCKGLWHTSGSGYYDNYPGTAELAHDRPFFNWYWSGTPATAERGDQYKSVRLTHEYAQGDQRHTYYGFSVRMFKDY